ncbi:MAG: HEPN domain-containing protein [Nanoarchaeota archaeon]|nr:HEPN domain-containing protein [Nanoarchaeota archaeon]
MKKQGFLRNLEDEGKLELVDPSEDICRSYMEKSDNCMKSAKILLENELYENSVSMSYYAMYNSLTALLFGVGIKCENHTGSMLLLNRLFRRTDLFRIISSAKKERIDKQYYVSSKDNGKLEASSAREMTTDAEDFVLKIRLISRNLNQEDIEDIRQRFRHMP